MVEIIDSADHRADTVLKKEIYEEFKVPRVWMVDPRYDNVEFYHGTPHGLALKGILAGKEILQEGLLPGWPSRWRNCLPSDYQFPKAVPSWEAGY